MEGIVDKTNIGSERLIEVGVHESKRLLVICRHFTAAELETRGGSFPFTAICLAKGNVEKLTKICQDIKNSLNEVAMGMPVENYKICLGEDLYVSLDSTSYTAQIRRYWRSKNGLAPTRSGVSMSPDEMMNLLAVIERMLNKMDTL